MSIGHHTQQPMQPISGKPTTQKNYPKTYPSYIPATPETQKRVINRNPFYARGSLRGYDRFQHPRTPSPRRSRPSRRVISSISLAPSLPMTCLAPAPFACLPAPPYIIAQVNIIIVIGHCNNIRYLQAQRLRYSETSTISCECSPLRNLFFALRSLIAVTRTAWLSVL